MPDATFGLFDWIDRGNVPLHQLYEKRLQLSEAADATRFFCYHLAGVDVEEGRRLQRD